MRSLVILAFALAACASYGGYGLHPGVSTADDVRRTMGAPGAEYANSDGTRELVYPRGPLGTQTFIAHVDSRGILAGMDQVLDDDHFRHIQAGLTREDVLRRIGPPGGTMEFSRQHQVAWEYRYIDTWGYLCEYSVTFDARGIVVSTFSQRLGQDRDRM